MKNKLFLSTVIFLMSVSIAMAQNMGALTIFSENGEKFYLILDGLRQNNDAKTNVRVDGLTKPGYTVKIIFEDKTLPEISKQLMVEDVNHVMMDATYKIKHDKNGIPKLAMLPTSFTPYQQQAAKVPAPDVYVVHYGVPDPAPATTTVQTTTTTTTLNPDAQINVTGINVSVSTPAVTTTQTTTTRTTTTGTISPQPEKHREHHGCAEAYAMSSGDFISATGAIRSESFDETKLSTAKQIAETNCLSAAQIADICKLFTFEENKLAFAKLAYKHCTEPDNYFKVNGVFTFSSSTDELNKYVETNR